MMKRFKFLGALFVGLIGFISFGYCGYITVEMTSTNITFRSNITKSWNYNFCLMVNGSCASDISLYDNNNNLVSSSLTQGLLYCVGPGYSFINHGSDCSASQYTPGSDTWNYYGFGSGDCVVEDCPAQYDSLECQQVYSLMPVSSCDSEYCELNGMCGVSGTGLSELYINGVNHLSAPEINLLIPLEYQWDYIYTGDSLNINISGYNVDYEYIDNIINTQRSTPDDEDLNNIVSGLIPLFVPGLVLIVFIIFIFRFIKKIF